MVTFLDVPEMSETMVHRCEVMKKNEKSGGFFNHFGAFLICPNYGMKENGECIKLG